MRVEMSQQAIALPGHDLGQSFPALKSKNPLADCLAAFGAVPRIQKGCGVVFEAAADEHFHIGNLMTLLVVTAGVRCARLPGSPG